MPIVQDVLSENNNIETHDNFGLSKNDLSKNDLTENDSSDTESADNAILRDCVRSVLTNYINDLEGHTVDDLYQLVLAEVEAPLLETILGHTNGNQSKAAQMLGINRGTLRKKLKQYNINE